jgi:hypothetical protein
MKSILRSRSALVRTALLTALLPLAVFAQTPAAPAAEKTAAPAPARQSDRFTFIFPGGTVSDFAAFLSTDAATKQGFFNLIVDPAAAKLTLPAFEIRNAGTSALALALSLALDSQQGYVNESTGYKGDPANPGTGAGGSPVFIAGVRRPHSEASADTPPITHPFVIADLLKPSGPFEITDIVGAIRAAWELDPAKKPASLNLQYHEPSRLLLASGPMEVVSLAQKVIEQMSATAKIINAAQK